MSAVEIPIHGKCGVITHTLIDLENLPSVSLNKWFIDKDGYVWRHAYKNGKHTTSKLHREITKAPVGMDVDHINGNRLDNRLANLRVCTHAQNMMNRKTCNAKSGALGIKKTPNGTWNARITHGRREIHIGNYRTLDEAIAARKEVEIKLRGEYASCH
jgi:hypothetical protein